MQLSETQPAFRQILGVRFFSGSPQDAVKIGLSGGLVVVPAAPALIELSQDQHYREALLGSDLAITDSGLMVLVWRLTRREKLIRVSGLEYLRLLLEEPCLREPGNVVWIMPTAKARDRNLTWLRAEGFPFTDADCYLAPMYAPGQINDPDLLTWLAQRRVKHIIVALGVGTQERLGLYLRNQLAGRPGIHCIGAAIGFLSGEQVNIPMWADYLFLGWLFRCIYEPGKFIPRYWRAKKLVSIMLRYGENMPPLVPGKR
jgi:UDP-N-acetyl-D-mannosaminuronic acid transferase (WecB/TagA/CpsF family)